MSMKNWLKAGALSTALGLTAATGAMAQESDEPKGEKTEVVQQQDYSAIPADRIEIIADGKTIQPRYASRLTGPEAIENAQDGFDINTQLQHKHQQNDMLLSRILRAEGVNMTPETEITINVFKGEEKVASFDADDAPKLEEAPKNEADPNSRTRTRTRGGMDGPG